MGLTVSDNGGGTFTPAPAGTHRAVAVQVIDLGTQWSEYYQKSSHKVLIGWELTDELNEHEDNKPHLVWQRYTASLHDNSRLRGHLESWRGRKFTEAELKGFHLKNILGAPCMISVSHDESNGKTYARVNAVTALPKSMEKPERVNDLILFDIEDWDDAVFETFSENLQKTINNSEEVKARNGQPKTTAAPANAPDAGTWDAVDDDSIPF